MPVLLRMFSRLGTKIFGVGPEHQAGVAGFIRADVVTGQVSNAKAPVVKADPHGSGVGLNGDTLGVAPISSVWMSMSVPSDANSKMELLPSLSSTTYSALVRLSRAIPCGSTIGGDISKPRISQRRSPVSVSAQTRASSSCMIVTVWAGNQWTSQVGVFRRNFHPTACVFGHP